MGERSPRHRGRGETGARIPGADARRPPSEERLRLYAATVLEFNRDPEQVVDLRRPISEAEARLLAGLGLDGPFAVVTAWNPRGRSSHPDNDARQAELEATLRARGIRFVAVDGCSPDRTHREASVAAAIPEGEARRLALEWEQDALFWFDGGHVWIVGALERYGRVRLPWIPKP